MVLINPSDDGNSNESRDDDFGRGCDVVVVVLLPWRTFLLSMKPQWRD
jgi:hypothetical protein